MQGWDTSLLVMDPRGNPDFEYSAILSSSDRAPTLASLTRRTAPPAPAVPPRDVEAKEISSSHCEPGDQLTQH